MVNKNEVVAGMSGSLSTARVCISVQDGGNCQLNGEWNAGDGVGGSEE